MTASVILSILLLITVISAAIYNTMQRRAAQLERTRLELQRILTERHLVDKAIKQKRNKEN